MQVLYKHGLIMYDTARRVWLLHMAVKTTSAQLVVDKSVLPTALMAMALHVALHLAQWGVLYDTGGASTQLALQLAREHQADTLSAYAHLATTTAATPEVVAAAGRAHWFCNYGMAMHANPSYVAAWRSMVTATAVCIPNGQLHATANMCLAQGLRSQGNNAEAEPMYRLALQLRTDLLGLEHADTAACINGLSLCLAAQKKFADAEPLYRLALELRTKLLGPDHTETIRSISNLAGFFQAQGLYAQAEPLFRQALHLRMCGFGPEHPDTTNSVNNLATCLEAQGKHSEAETMYRTALDLRTRLLGAECHDTIESLSNLATCLVAQRKFPEAVPMLRDVLASRTQTFGAENSKAVAVAERLADCLASMHMQI